MLLVLGSVGLIVHAHEAVPELATLAALCGAFAALAVAQTHPLAAGLAFGVALGAGAASSNWAAPAALYLAVLAGYFVHAPSRTRRALLFMVAAIVVAVPLGVALAGGAFQASAGGIRAMVELERGASTQHLGDAAVLRQHHWMVRLAGPAARGLDAVVAAPALARAAGCSCRRSRC
jgi:hypothetical protein